MPLFTRILAPTDYSDCASDAVRFAARLAAENDGELHVIHVVGKTPLRYAVREGMLTSEDTDDSLTRKASDAAHDELATEIERVIPGVTLAARAALFGDPGREIIDYADENDIDVIVMGRRGETLADVILGSTAERVIRHSPCPVLIAKSKGL